MSEPIKVKCLKLSHPFDLYWIDGKVIQIEVDLFPLVDSVDYHDFPSSVEFIMDEDELMELMNACKSLLAEIKAQSPKAKRSKRK